VRHTLRAPWIAASLATWLLATGCASTLKEQFQQPPSRLDADPNHTGLVVLDFGLGREGYLPEIVHGAHLLAAADGKDLYAPRLEVAFESFGVLFHGLAPGRYRVTQVLGVREAGNARQVASWAVADTSLEFEVRPGELSYVGPFWATPQGRSASISWWPRPGRERTVWRAVARKYPTSPWGPVIRRRVEALESATAGGRAADYPDPPKRFEHIVLSEKLGAYARRAGPVGIRGTLIVSPEGVEYSGKHTLTIATEHLRAVSREGRWVKVEFDLDGVPKRVWIGFGSYADSEVTDRIEFSIASLLEPKR
jgi:hypothetical protein